MTAAFPAPAQGPALAAPGILDHGLEPFERMRSRWPALLGGAVTLLLAAGLAHQLLDAGLQGLENALPANPLFYLAILGTYLALPVCDYVIFRRLWGLPLSGLVPLLKKRVANELVLGYSGEAYFYAWARARMRLVAAPFAAIKDVSILSAIAGNLVTLAMLAAATPFALSLMPARYAGSIAGSAAIVVAMSLAIVLFRGRLFSLPARDLRWITGVHALRIVAGTLLLGLSWHLALPAATLGMWLVLSTLRMLVSRLPLIPNKDLLFANLAVLLVGQDDALARLMAITAALTLLLHGLVIAFAAGWAIRGERA